MLEKLNIQSCVLVICSSTEYFIIVLQLLESNAYTWRKVSNIFRQWFNSLQWYISAISIVYI